MVPFTRSVLLVLALTLSGGAGGAAPAMTPLPPPRPSTLESAPEPPKATPPAPPKPQPAEPEQAARSCTARLQALGYDVRPAPAPSAAQAACHIEEPVVLAGIRSGEASLIRVDGSPVVDCSLAMAVGEWASQVAEPLLSRAMGARLVALRDVGGFECRNRNRRPDGKLSAHAQGLAMDIGAFEFANGGRLRVADPGGVAKDAFAALRRAACGWFLTVLGPGSDADHATHLHLDLQRHGSSDRYRICQ